MAADDGRYCCRAAASSSGWWWGNGEDVEGGGLSTEDGGDLNGSGENVTKKMNACLHIYVFITKH